MEIKRHEKILKRNSTVLLVVDIQERILKVINEWERVVENSIKLIKGFQILNLPVLHTEQYPKGLGPTVPRDWVPPSLQSAKCWVPLQHLRPLSAAPEQIIFSLL
jgi:hypothetical protein